MYCIYNYKPFCMYYARWGGRGRETDPLLKSIIEQMFEGIRGFLSTLFDKYDLHNVGNGKCEIHTNVRFPVQPTSGYQNLK